MVRLANILLILFLIIALTPLKVTHADSTLVVTALDDEDGNGPDCSLREAIIAVGSGQDYGGCTHNTSFPVFITFDSTVFASDRTITLNSALPDLGGSITIDGGSAGHITISGNHLSSRIFTIAGGAAVTLQNLTLRDSNDGAVSNIGTLTLRNVTITGNSTGGSGGGLNNAGTAVVVNSTISSNFTNNGGGVANTGALTLVNSTITNNIAGGILNAGTALTLYNTIVANNQLPFLGGSDCSTQGNAITTAYNSLVKDGGCGVTSGVNGNLTGDPLLNGLGDNGGPTQTYLPQPSSPVINAGNNSYLSEATLNLDLNGDGDIVDTLDTDQRGAGYARIRAGTVDMGAVEAPPPFTGLVVDTGSDDDLRQCSAEADDCSLRGAINLANQLDGTDTITFDSTIFSTPQTMTLGDRLPDITSSMNIIGPGANVLTINRDKPKRPFYINTPGVVTISGLTITQGAGDYGAAVDINYGFVTLKSVVLSNNHATQQGGAVILSNGGNPSLQGTLWVIDSTFSGNVANGQGGAIYSAGTVIVSNSTFSGNSASQGGAIYASASGTVELFSTTVDSSATSGGGGAFAGDGRLVMRNSILADSTNGADCAGTGTLDIQSSLIEDGSCAVTNGVNGNLTGDPLLDPLNDNGGPTQTYLPQPTSPVMNAGDNSYLSEATLNLDLNGDGDTADTLDTDQRGFHRIAQTIVDMGAAEYSHPFSGLVVDSVSDNNLTDCSDLPNDCSLRGAINLANALAGTDTITFDNAVFSTAQTITLARALPDMTTNLIIDGGTAGRVTVSGNHLSYRVFVVSGGATVTLQNLMVSDGGDGGIYNNGTLILYSMTITQNVTASTGGGIENTGKLYLLNSTLSGNTAQVGGGLRNYFTGNMVIVNSSVSGNSALSSDGGLRNLGILKVVSSTISDNSAGYANGGIENTAPSLDLYNTIVANNYVTGNNAGSPTYDIECSYGIGTVNIYNSLVKDGSCSVSSGSNRGNGNLIGDPLLGPLTNNGGLTQTQLPLPASPVVNAGNNIYLSEATLNLDLNGDGDTIDTINTDQRGTGYSRISGTAVDMGAVEVHTVPTNAVPPINYYPSKVVKLTWSSLSWTNAYEVQVSSDKLFTQLQCGGTLQAGANLSIDTCQLDAGTYYWRVRGKSSSQTNTTWSKPDTFVIAIP